MDINNKYKKYLDKYKYLFLSVVCLALLSVLMYMSNNNQDMFKKAQEVAAPIKIYEEKDEKNSIEISFTSLNLDEGKLVDVKEKINLATYLQNPEYTLVKEYFNYKGDGKSFSPICNFVEVDKVSVENRVLKIDLISVGEKKYTDEIIEKISKFNNDLKELAVKQTFTQLKNVDSYEITLNKDKLESFSYINKTVSN